jgi:hypothetical protein
MFRNPGITWGAAEFKCQSTNCIAMLSARTIINTKDILWWLAIVFWRGSSRTAALAFA